MQRDLDIRGEFRDHAYFIQRDDPYASIRKIFWQETAARREAVIGVRNGKVNLLNPDFQCVARLSAFDEYWSIENVTTWSLVGDLLIDITKILLHLFRRYARCFKPRRT